MTASIPTMPCPECECPHAALKGGCTTCDTCERCGYTGRIPRPPLPPDQVAGLPDGARVVVEDTAPRCLRRGVITGNADRVATLRLMRDGCRVWLAEDADG